MKILRRKQLNKRLKAESEKAVVINCAPMGYGKTTGLWEFLSHTEETIVSLSLEGQEDEEWVWTQLQTAIEETYDTYSCLPHVAIPANLKENEDWICRVFGAGKKTTHIILDDFVWGKFPQIEQWICLCICEPEHRVKLWILAREVASGKILEYVFQKKVGMLQTEDYQVSYEEIQSLCQREGVRLEDDMCTFILQYTNGWMAAIQRALSLYKEDGNLYRLAVLDDLVKIAFFLRIDSEMKQALIKISILDEFTFEQAVFLCENQKVRGFLIDLLRKNRFVYQVEGNRYCISPVCNEMLKRELMRSEMDLEALYRRGGDWLLHANNPEEAIQYYIYYGDYDKILEVLLKYEDRSLMDTAPELIKKVFRGMPECYQTMYPYIYMKWIQDIVTNEDIDEGKALLEAFAEKIKTGDVKGDYSSLMGEYYFAKAFTCFNDARKMHHNFILAHKFFSECGQQKSKLSYQKMVDTFGSNHMLYLYHNEAGDLKSLLEDIQDKAKYFISISGGVNVGMEKQCEAEYAFETGDYTCVEELAAGAFQEARMSGRNSICICSLFLRGRLGILSGDAELLVEMQKRLRQAIQKAENPIIRCEAECAQAYLYALRNEKEKIPKWIRSGQEEEPGILPQNRGNFYIAHGMYLILARNYKRLLSLSSTMEILYEKQEHIFGRIYTYIFRVIGIHNVYGLKEVGESAWKLLELCEADHVITPLLEFGGYISEALESIVYRGGFLREVHSMYVQHSKNIEEPKGNYRPLTKKEEEVAQLTLAGMRVREVAKKMEISDNTVRSHLKSIYRKLNVNSRIGLVNVYGNFKIEEN